MTKNNRDLPGALLAWYNRHARRLPWRAPPGAKPDPYRVWLSEIMLQQTTVVTVGPYFERFVARWPSVQALAASPLEEILTEWAGLGYYARARNLHRAAQMVTDKFDGRFPDDEAGLKSLPGIGDYTAAAIAAIAFDRPAAVLDGNIERVTSRLYAITEPLPGVKPVLRRLVAEITPRQRPGDFAQAMMDLGAMVCQPARPRCLLCPLVRFCEGSAQGIAAELPRKAAKKARPTRHGIAFWITDEQGRVLLRKRPEKGLLGSMTEIPSTDWREDKPSQNAAANAAPLALDWSPLQGRVRHVFTHFSLELEIWSADVEGSAAPEGTFWCRLDDLGNQALPSLMRKIVKHVLTAK
ncbi:A/G-specific adenine glycosylase [Limibacillus halophilus]|uniref:Adenine DNA glycosylase n=1 Tax=Limibacillus halophilus TaxID=1579333 RepID=A0A839SW94_9PROT|nr:A/G-specific adenine glycosylase [Limibacillus halophilus]MBB3065954.1 A/G-specific adenine glycosylase [Limibacillus halophilus]